jgi:hypothetical protein
LIDPGGSLSAQKPVKTAHHTVGCSRFRNQISQKQSGSGFTGKDRIPGWLLCFATHSGDSWLCLMFLEALGSHWAERTLQRASYRLWSTLSRMRMIVVSLNRASPWAVWRISSACADVRSPAALGRFTQRRRSFHGSPRSRAECLSERLAQEQRELAAPATQVVHPGRSGKLSVRPTSFLIGGPDEPT